MGICMMSRRRCGSGSRAACLSSSSPSAHSCTCFGGAPRAHRCDTAAHRGSYNSLASLTLLWNDSLDAVASVQ